MFDALGVFLVMLLFAMFAHLLITHGRGNDVQSDSITVMQLVPASFDGGTP